jgi:hypothetical protein
MKTSICTAILLAHCADAVVSGNGCTPMGQEILEHASL